VLSTLNTSHTTKSSDLGWVSGILLRSSQGWSRFAKIQTGFGLNFLPVFGGIESRAFRTTFSIASPARRLKCWWSRLIGGGQVIAWDGFNGSFH
jgi:hypothetical protein